jgi:copper chaperone CopZ
MRKASGVLLAAALALLALDQGLRAQAPALATTITVEGMHCPSCAKNIADRLYQVPGVAAVQADVAASRLAVGPKAGQAPSPRALWEAVEQAGYRPVRLEGPAGTFTARPQS